MNVNAFARGQQQQQPKNAKQNKRTGGGRRAAHFSPATDEALAMAYLPVVERLEDRRLFAQSQLPFALEFDSDRGGLTDKDGQGTGFTRVQTNKNGNQYMPSLIDLDTTAGVLKLTTYGTATAGGNYNNDNTLVNALETEFDGTTAGFSITARLVGPLGYLNNPSEQGGVMFGPDQDNYVKLIAVSTPEGPRIQFLDEQTTNGVYTHALVDNNDVATTYTNVGSFANINTLDLRLVGDAGTGKVTAYYAVNGGAFVKVAKELTLTGSKKSAFFNAASRAGLITMHKNDLGAQQVVFDRFEIKPGTPVGAQPRVTATRPSNGQTNVARDSFIAADVYLPTPGAGVDAATLTSQNVKLYRTSDGAMVAGVINTTGGGDAIVFTPTGRLDANTGYTFEVTGGVKDTSGASFQAYKVSFTTGTTGGEIDTSVAFEKVTLPTAQGHKYTVVKVGPDGKLYAGTEAGLIQRFTINADGTLSAPQNINTVRAANGNQNRLLIGMAFDPASTAANPILWVSHSHGALEDAPDWTGKVSRLSGANLATYADAVVNLPRSVRDHVTNQMAFGPDGKLYFSQGAMSAMGAPDNAWDLRNEHLLSAAILRLDTTKVGATPIDVKTEDGGTYNPFATGAPVQIYAYGIRNAYDLVWHSNGHLYTATNGSAAGGNTPAGGGAPALTNVGTQPDLLFDVQQGKYYGHPNPKQGFYVLNGGNPTGGVDNLEVTEYPVGTQPSANYGGAAYNFGKNYSTNGLLEYTGDAFGGSLKGALMVTRYSGGDDVIVLKLNAGGQVVETKTGVAGLTGFVDPLDLEQTADGNMYVAEYGASRLTLVRPTATGAQPNVVASKPRMVFNDTTASGSSPDQTIKFTNTGTGALTLPSDAFSLSGADAGRFTIVSKPSGAVTLQPGQSVDVVVRFTANTTTTATRPGGVGIYAATLVVKSNDPDSPVYNVALRGLGTAGTGGVNEPSLQRIFDLYELGITVGDSNPLDVYLDNPPGTPNDELTNIHKLIKAGSGNVTIEPLAVFGVGHNSYPTLKFGWYSAGTKAAKNELFSIKGANAAQTVNPAVSGTLTFDPGAKAFGLYGLWPSMQTVNRTQFPQGTETYSEAALNQAFDPASPRKFRFYPLKENGVVIPNAYVVAVEEFNGGYDNQDFVFVIRNVTAAPAGPEIGLENQQGTPYPDRMIFSRISNPNTTFPNGMRDTAKVRIRNTGTSALTVTGMSLSSSAWELVGAPSGSFSIAAGGYYDVTVRFKTNSGNLHTGTLSIVSNDSDEATTVVQLAGWRQNQSENNEEPSLQQMFQIFGYGTTVTKSGQVLDKGGKVDRVGDEILSPYWKQAESWKPVTVTQLAAYHTQGDYARVRWFTKGSDRTTSGTSLFIHENLDGQTFLPRADGSGNLAGGSFNSSGAFGFRIDAAAFDPNTNGPSSQILKEWSDPTFNMQEQGGGGYGHHVRFFVAKDKDGNVIPSTFFMVVDYAGINYDYQDNVYLIENVVPDSGPSTPTGATATGGGNGVALNWNDNNDAYLAGYNVYRASSAGGTYTKVNAALLTASEYIDLTAPEGTSYYRIVAVDRAGNESAPLSVSGTRGADTTPPATPTGLTATPSLGGISLDWANNTDGDLAGYNVYRATSAGGTYVKVNGSLLTGSAFNDTGAPAGAASYYRVVAVDAAGNESTAATISATRPAADTTPPAAPTGLTGSGTQSGVSLDWANNGEGDLAGYNVYRASSAGGTYVKVNGSLLTGSAFTDAGAPAGATSYYRITAVDTAGNESAFAAISVARPPSDGTTTPVVKNPVADAYVRGGSYTGQNFGSDTTIALKHSTNSSNIRQGYLRFDLTGLQAGPGGIKLRLYGYIADTTAPADVTLYGVADTAWSESGITFTNAPAAGAAIGTTHVDAIYSGQARYFEWDVTSYVAAQLAAGNTAVSFALKTGNNALILFNSAEAATNRPEMTGLVQQGGGTPGDTTPPAAPTGATGGGSTAGNAIDWNDNAEPDLAGYYVYRSSSAGGTYVKISGLLTGSNFTDAGAPAGATSYYRIVAVDAAGNESAFAAISVARPPAADTTPPAAPTGLTGSGSTSGVSLDWANNGEGDLAGYNVYRASSAGGTYVKVNGSLLTGSEFVDTGAPAGATSYYRIVAVDAAGNESAFAAISVARPPAADTTPPAAPSGLTGSGAQGGITLDWADNAEADLAGYYVYRSSSSGGTYVKISGLLTGSGYVDTGAPAGETSHYRVVAVDEAGNESAFAYVNAVRPLPTSGAVVRNPVADATVRGGTYGNNNYGSDDSLTVKDNSSASSDREAFIKFDLTGLGGVSSVVLRLFGYVADSSSPLTVAVYGMGNPNWSESTITFNNRPTGATLLGTTVVDAIGVNNPAWFAWNVTSYVQQQIAAGATAVTFLVKTGANIRAEFNSDEATANRPELVFTGSAPSDTTPPAAPGGVTGSGSTAGNAIDWNDNTEPDFAGYNVYRASSAGGTYAKVNAGLLTNSDVTDTGAPAGATSHYRITAVDAAGNESAFTQISVTRPPNGGGTTTPVTKNPVADATVRGGSYASQNFGSAGTLSLKNNSNVSYDREAYLRFDLADLSPTGTVKLRLYGWVADSGNAGNATLYGVPDTTWSESGITFNNAPALGSNLGTQAIDSIGGGQAKYFEWDVTSYVAAQIAAGKTQVSFALRTSADIRVEFNSNEAAANRPELVGQTTGGGPGSTPVDEAPAAPRSLTGSGSTSGVSLDWANNGESDLAGYNVYRASSAGGTYVKVNGSLLTASAFTDAGAPAGATSHYRVTAVDAAGNESAFATVSVARPVTPDTDAPAAPTGLVATGSTAHVALDWNDNGESDLAGYNVYRSNSANGTYVKVNTGLVTGSSFDDATAPANVISYYKVTAVDTAGNESAQSASANAIRSGSTTTITKSPTDGSTVRNGSNANTNYGTAPTLEVKDSPTWGYDRVSYLKFDLSGVTTVSNAVVRLYGYLVDFNRPTGIGLYGTSNTSWDESSVTWNSAPTIGALLDSQTITGFGGGNAGWYEFDVTAYLQAAVNAGATEVSFALKATVVDSNVRVSFNSGENATNRPELVIAA